MAGQGDEASGPGVKPERRPDPARDRLAAALRENLQRRKAQARFRRAATPDGDPCDPTDTGREKDR